MSGKFFVLSCCMSISAIVSLGLILCKRREERSVYWYWIPSGLFITSLIFFSLYLELSSNFYSGCLEFMGYQVDKREAIDRTYAIVCSIVFCMAATFWLWTRLVSEGEKRKKLWISGGVSLAVLILMVVSCLFHIEGFLVETFFIAYLLVALMYCMGISAVVSLGLILWTCRKNKRAYLIPLILFTAALIFGVALSVGYFLCLVWAFRNWGQ